MAETEGRPSWQEEAEQARPWGDTLQGERGEKQDSTKATALGEEAFKKRDTNHILRDLDVK